MFFVFWFISPRGGGLKQEQPRCSLLDGSGRDLTRMKTSGRVPKLYFLLSFSLKNGQQYVEVGRGPPFLTHSGHGPTACNASSRRTLQGTASKYGRLDTPSRGLLPVPAIDAVHPVRFQTLAADLNISPNRGDTHCILEGCLLHIGLPKEKKPKYHFAGRIQSRPH